MKGKVHSTIAINEEEQKSLNEFHLQTDRIRRVLDEAIYRLKVLKALPFLIAQGEEILLKYLNKTEADFVTLVCKQAYFSKAAIEERSDLMLISNMLDKINMFEKSRGASGSIKKNKSFLGSDNYEAHVAFAVDIIFKSKPLVEYMLTIEEEEPEPLITSFIESMVRLRQIANNRLQVSAAEELKRENDLKTAFRSSMMLSDNIQELEEQLEKQRQELGREHERKQTILEDLAEKIEALQEKAKEDIQTIVYDSEILMMKDYNKSSELQKELSQKAKETTQQYESLLEEHLHQENALRAKRFKVETQLASWVAKYDQDLGEKQAEYEELEKTFNAEREEYEMFQEKFDEQEEEYLVLMAEKEAEEARIHEEKAWIFLQNKAARKIQRYWRAYRLRKLIKKKKKGKKKASANGKNDKKSPKDEPATTLKGGPDPNALLRDKFSSDVLAEIRHEDAFAKKDVVVDLVE